MGWSCGFAGVTMDITDRKEFEDALRRSRREALSRFRELRRLYENAPVGLALLDRDFRFLRVNALFAALNGIDQGEHLGRRIYDVLPELGDRENVLRQALIAAEPVRDLEAEADTPGASQRKTALRMNFYPLLDDRGSLTGIGVVAQDVTAQKRAERAQALLSRELNHRIKNLFAVISGIVTLSARGHGGLVAFGRTVRGRIEALSKAHDLARHGENGLESAPVRRPFKPLSGHCWRPIAPTRTARTPCASRATTSSSVRTPRRPSPSPSMNSRPTRRNTARSPMSKGGCR